MKYTQSIGNLIELKCMQKFIELGYDCSIPYGNSAKYDFIADVNGMLLKIQCKSCYHPRNKRKNSNSLYDTDAIIIHTTAQTINTKKIVIHKYSKEQIDYFATYFNNKVYLINVEECNSEKVLRFKPPDNNSPYNKAEDYEIEKVLPFSEEFVSSKENFYNLRKNLTIYNEFKCLKCLKCNCEITKYSKSGLCPDCWHKMNRKIERPTREELKDMIRNESFTSIGKKFGISDNSIKKWCISFGLPSKKTEIKLYTDEEWSSV